jgi:hypothetical protein
VLRCTRTVAPRCIHSSAAATVRSTPRAALQPAPAAARHGGDGAVGVGGLCSGGPQVTGAGWAEGEGWGEGGDGGCGTATGRRRPHLSWSAKWWCWEGGGASDPQNRSPYNASTPHPESPSPTPRLLAHPLTSPHTDSCDPQDLQPPPPSARYCRPVPLPSAGATSAARTAARAQGEVVVSATTCTG